jgi:ABC-type transport system involved in multi-copper enzyme maturation permease subunit
MTFFVLLTKEMRLRMRQERTIWILIFYVVLLSLLGWLYLSLSTGGSFHFGYDWTSTGTHLYQLLTTVEILLIIFITPSFTSAAINSEKEFKTYDMLLCSSMSAFSLATGKLIAGLTNVFLLIAAPIPLFSLVFFFGGMTPAHVLKDLILFIVTAIMIACFGLLCSTLFAKRSTSTAIAYLAVLLWLIVPFIYLFFVPAPFVKFQFDQPYSLHILAWNPVVILSLNGGIFSSYGFIAYKIDKIYISSWLVYILLSVGASLLFFLLSLCFVKPHLQTRMRACLIAYRKKRKKTGNTSHAQNVI